MFRYEVSYQNDSKVWVDLSDWVRPIIDKSTLDETHDESQIFLSCSSIDTPFKPFTHFIINIEEINEDGTPALDENNNPIVDTLYRVVIADDMEQVVFDDSEPMYDHNIRLAEATKELERYTVDNLSFTNYWAKAFNTSATNYNVIEDTTHTGWYNNRNFYIKKDDSTVGDIYYYPQCFTDAFSNDAFIVGGSGTSSFPNIQNTIITKIFKSRAPKLSGTIDNSYMEGSSFIIPSLSLNLNTYAITLFDMNTRLFTYSRAFAYFDYNYTCTLINPLGVSISVNPNDSIVFDNVGVYKLRYTINTNVRFYSYDIGSFSGKISNENWTAWFNGNTCVIEYKIYAVNNVYADIEKLSVYDILNKICQVTPTRFKDTDQQKFFISENCRNKYGTVEAPELIITGKNLWEALKIIGGIVNAIPYLKIEDQYNWNVIDFMPLSSEERTANTVEEEYCNSESGYLSDSYTASYDVYAENMINPLSTNEGQINEAGWYIAKTLRSEEVEISETSMDIETVYPIYRVNKLRFVDYSASPITDKDITPYLEEWALYNTETSNEVGKGKDIHLYFKQGSRNIYGLQYKVSKNDYADAVNKVSIKKILHKVTGVSEENINLLTAKFIVEYVPYLNARIRYFKTNAPKLNIDTSMFQNQSSNVVDTIALGRKMVANLGRTSNLGYVDSIKVYHLNEIPLKGQRTNDGYFVSDVITEYDQNHLLASVSYTKDYQKISEYINIQNLQRYFEVSEKQSLDRYVNTHMFYIFGSSVAEINKEFGLNQSTELGTNYPTTNYIASLLYDHGLNRKINGSLINSYGYNYQLTSDLTYQADKAYYTQTGDRYDYLVPGVDYTIGGAITQPNTTIYDTTLDMVARLYLNSNAVSSGNQISIITDFQDNYGAGYQSKPYTSYWHSSDWYYHSDKNYYKLNNDGTYTLKIEGTDYNNGAMVATTNNYESTNARMNKAVPYANQYGEVKEMQIYNLTDSSIHYPDEANATLEANMTTLANSLPAVTALDSNNQPTGSTYFKIADDYENDNMPTMSAVGCKQTIQLNKDSREIIHINQQHHFLKNKDDLIIGNAMTEKCRFIQQTSFKSRLVFLSDTIDDYEFKIKADDIITVQPIGTDERLTRSTILADLCNEIKASNILEILSAENRDGIQINTRYSGANITGVSVNQTTWESQVQYSGFYTFIYDGANWTYAEETIDLADYGITITGTASENDSITVVYNKNVFIQPLAQYNGYIAGLTADAKAWAIVTEDNDLIIGQNIDLYADDLTHDNYIPAIYMSVTSQY